MSNIENIRADILSDLFEEQEISATREQIEAISKQFYSHIEMENEMSSYYRISTKEKKCYTCQQKDTQIKSLQRDIEIYNNNIKRRLNAESVYIQHGSVMYDMR